MSQMQGAEPWMGVITRRFPVPSVTVYRLSLHAKRRYNKGMKNQKTYKRYGHRPTSAKCIVLDMDDTLCHYDEVTRLRCCSRFRPRDREMTLARAAQRHGYDLVIATARPTFCWPDTALWLSRHGLRPAATYMRNGYVPQEKPTSQVKVDMLTSIRRIWDVEAFYDDSPANCLAAKAIGVPTVWVPGNHEYWVANAERHGEVLPADWHQRLTAS